MPTELTLTLAFLAGLAGAGHCWTMCGGLVGGLFMHAGAGQRIDLHLAYHAGRVTAYSLLGGLAAGLGQAIVLTGSVGRVQGVLYVVAGLLAVAAGVWALRRPPECACPNTGLRALQATAGRYFLAGFINGLMPCALVFSLTLKAATAPSIATGAAWLTAFGLGTLPAMVFAAAVAHGLSAQAMLWLRRLAGGVVIGLGLEAMWAGAKFFHVMLHL